MMLLLLDPIHILANEDISRIDRKTQPVTNLNLRFSNRPLIPPEDLIVQTIPLSGISVAAPFVAPSPQAVIFEDAQRQRVAILSMQKMGQLLLYLLEPLPLDPELPALVQCANTRGCQIDRTPLTGGFGCLALCLKEVLERASGQPLPH